MLLPRREERRMRAAVAHRHAEALRVADGDVGAPLAGGFEQREGEQVGRDRHERTHGVRPLAHRVIVLDLAVRQRILEQRADHAGPELEGRGIGDDGLDAARLGAGANHGDRLRVAPFCDHEERRRARRRLRHRLGQVHGFGGGGGFIEQRGVGDGEGGEIGDHRLEVEQRFEPSLGDLRLIRRVGGVPARVLDHVPLDHLRRERVVVAHPDVRAEQLVLRRETAQRLEHLALGPPRRERQWAAQPDALGHHAVDELFRRCAADRLQHRPRLIGARPDVAGHEAVGGEQGRACGRHVGCLAASSQERMWDRPGAMRQYASCTPRSPVVGRAPSGS